MNWEALGAVGDLVGGVAVVLSLAYIAYQIRQSSRQIELSSRNIEASMFQQTADSFSRFSALLVQDATIVDLWLRGLSGEKLPANDSIRFDQLMNTLFLAFGNAHYQHQLGSAQLDTLDINRETLKALLRSPGGARWWKNSAPRSLSPEFRAAVESLFET